MSAKLPVGPTINEAFQFGLNRWITAVRFGWLPVVVISILFVAFFATAFKTEAFLALESGGAEPQGLKDIVRAPLPVFFAGTAVLYVVTVLLISGVIASLFRLVALGEERPGLFHLRVDGPAMRVFLAYLILGVLSFVVMGLAMCIGGLLAGQSPAQGLQAIGHLFAFAMNAQPGQQPPANMLESLSVALKPVMLGGLIGAVPLIYLNVKLTPFPAGSAAENRLLLFGAFRMTFGHFWSIFGVYVLFFLAAVIMGIIFQLVGAIVSLIAEFGAAQGGALAFVGAILALAVSVAALWFQFFMMAVQYAIPAIVYRRLKTGA